MDQGWLDEWMERALRAALNSPDPSTQNGAVLLGSDGVLIGLDCNRFPDGVAYEHPNGDTRWTRPLKYQMVGHAEHNAILDAALHGFWTNNSTLVCPWAACDRCAVTILMAGVSTLVRLKQPEEQTHERWDESIFVADCMFHEAGLEIIEMDPKDWGIALRRNGELYQP